MEQKDRDLLIRIDERLKQIKDGDEGDVPKILEHISILNKQVGKNTTARKIGTWLATIFFIAIMSIAIKIIIGG